MQQSPPGLKKKPGPLGSHKKNRISIGISISISISNPRRLCGDRRGSGEGLAMQYATWLDQAGDMLQVWCTRIVASWDECPAACLVPHCHGSWCTTGHDHTTHDGLKMTSGVGSNGLNQNWGRNWAGNQANHTYPSSGPYYLVARSVTAGAWGSAATPKRGGTWVWPAVRWASDRRPSTWPSGQPASSRN